MAFDAEGSNFEHDKITKAISKVLRVGKIHSYEQAPLTQKPNYVDDGASDVAAFINRYIKGESATNLFEKIENRAKQIDDIGQISNSTPMHSIDKTVLDFYNFLQDNPSDDLKAEHGRDYVINNPDKLTAAVNTVLNNANIHEVGRVSTSKKATPEALEVSEYIQSYISSVHRDGLIQQINDRANELDSQVIEGKREVNADTTMTEVDEVIYRLSNALQSQPTEDDKYDLATAHDRKVKSKKIKVEGRNIYDGNGEPIGRITPPAQPTFGDTAYMADQNAMAYQMGGAQTVTGGISGGLGSDNTSETSLVTRPSSDQEHTDVNPEDSFEIYDTNPAPDYPTPAPVDLVTLRPDEFNTIDPDGQQPNSGHDAEAVSAGSQSDNVELKNTNDFEKLISQYKKNAPVSWWTRRTLGTGKKGKIGDTSSDAKSNGRLLRDYMGDDTKFFAYQVALGHMKPEEALAQLQPVKPQQPEAKADNKTDADSQHAKGDVLDLTPNLHVDQQSQTTDSNLGEIIPEAGNSQDEKLAKAWEAYAKPEQKAPAAESQKKVGFNRSDTTEPDYASLADYASEHNGLGGADKMNEPLKEGETITFSRNGQSSTFEVMSVNPITGEADKIRLLTPKENKPSL